jgi:uncharacterized protein
MERVAFFFDTYAFHELIVGNKNYLPYKNCKIITTRLNLMELHYSLLKKYNLNTANKYFEKLLKFSIKIPNEIIKNANQFKHVYKKQKISYLDCIGYLLAKLHDVKFLTGDKEFENFENVEFVK